MSPSLTSPVNVFVQVVVGEAAELVGQVVLVLRLELALADV